MRPRQRSKKRTKKPSLPTTPAFSRRIVVAISGRSGRSLWTFALDPTFAHIIVQYWDKPAAFVRGKRSAQVAILDGPTLILLDATTGQPRSAPYDLGFGPVRPLQFADLTGDGAPEVIALGQGASPQQQSLTACSLDTGKPLWTVPIAARYPLPHQTFLRPEWPWLIDLDRDGQSEVIVPDSGPLPRKAAYRGLRVLSGNSGRSRWVRPMQPETKADDGLDKLVVAPDLDGDGFRELITVSRFDGRFPPASRSDPRTDPQQIYLDALSGRDGHPLWHWHIDVPEDKFTAIRPPQWWGRGPDGWPLLAVPLGGPEPGREFAPYNSYFNSPIVYILEASTGRELHQAMGLTRIGTADLDGDGTLDAAVMIRRATQPGQPEFELKVISLHDAVNRWSRLIHYDGTFSGYPAVVIGKGAPSEPATLFVEESPATSTSNELLVHALSGRDGADRWTWRSGAGEGDRKVVGGIDGIALDHAWTDAVCVTFSNLRRESRIVILDLDGKERASRSLPPENTPTNYFPPVGDSMVDLDGDGHDELIVWSDNRLSAWGSDLKDRWSFPTDDMSILRVVRPYPGRPSTLILPPSRAIDGTTGELRWLHKPFPLSSRNGGELLDPGNPTRLPRLIFNRNNPSATICRNALPATPKGDYLPPSGASPPPGLARDDPRWTRGLPWTNLMTPHTARTSLLAVTGLALLNVFVPLSLLWLAARRRPWSLRVSMALPVAVAVPLTAFQAVEPLLPIPPPSAPLPSGSLALFALGSAAGVPLIAYVILLAMTLLRRRWRNLLFLTAFTLLASFTTAAIWLWLDMRTMPAIERDSRSGWDLALLPGACAIGVLMLIICPIRQTTRWITRRRKRKPPPRLSPLQRGVNWSHPPVIRPKRRAQAKATPPTFPPL